MSLLKTGAGLEEIQHAILSPFNCGNEYDEGFLITSARHFDLLRRATEALRSSNVALHHKASEDMILIGFYDALRFLDELTGETTPEDISQKSLLPSALVNSYEL